MSAPQQSDKSAGFTGLILGGIALFVILFGIVRITNANYGSEEGTSKPAAEASK